MCLQLKRGTKWIHEDICGSCMMHMEETKNVNFIHNDVPNNRIQLDKDLQKVNKFFITRLVPQLMEAT